MVTRSILYHILLVFFVLTMFFIYHEYDNRTNGMKSVLLHQKIVNEIKNDVVLMGDIKEVVKNSTVESIKSVLKDNPEILLEIVKELEREKDTKIEGKVEKAEKN